MAQVVLPRTDRGPRCFLWAVPAFSAPWVCSPHSVRLELPPWATASGRTTEVPMHDEFTARQRAITLRLSGRSVQSICQALGRSERWFHKWWRRYLESGADGLYDLTHATQHVAQRIAPELERTILSIR